MRNMAGLRVDADPDGMRAARSATIAALEAEAGVRLAPPCALAGAGASLIREIFLELKRALNPLLRDPIPLRRPESSLRYRSAREQVVNTNIEHEEETYIRVGGLLYSFITLKDLPDATFPGMLRDLVGLDSPFLQARLWSATTGPRRLVQRPTSRVRPHQAPRLGTIKPRRYLATERVTRRGRAS